MGILSPGRGSPLAATPVPLELGQPPHSGVGLFPASKLGIGRGARQPSGSGFLGLEHIFPHPQQPCLNPTYKHRVLIPSWAQTFSPLSPPSPSSQGLVGAAQDPLTAARFFAKKGKDAAARAGEHLDPIPSMNGSWPRLS